ncbi:hypothetical protein KP509_03G023000 [Ceratopteris richardii]|uniref:RING-type E3 ubiquitin transferase n=1 Tax=Ceratopteris richardii TaxID=49495 RepID=A0A8T2V4R0_CERRI|nr:hypothetical protein KP509_03G023000 [Ceratopteris richardii]KAH7441043.1 hypothetical protein KP509_03G023000 [Ceratopteris richardii]KAH7441046.1 hypothetical protein KP509_03G023000 [Ceratopteris richardii]KAH7441047.1 hypothetical protein KP509_03G023000 [Ceratopteris richardii]
MVGGSAIVENSVEISAASVTNLGNNPGEHRNLHAPLKLKALSQISSGCSSCFGRAISAPRRFPGQEAIISGPSLRHRRGRRHCLRKLSCISSCDVIPSVTSSTSLSSDKQGAAHELKHRGESIAQLRTIKAAFITSAGSLVHRNLRRGLGGFLRERGSTCNARNSSVGLKRDSESSFRTGNWCLMRPAIIKSDTVIPSTALSRASSALDTSNSVHSRGDRDAPRSSTDSCETSLLSIQNDGSVSQRLVENFEGGNFCERESGMLDNAERSNITGMWMNSGFSGSIPRTLGTRDRSNLGTSIYSGPQSSARTARVPFLFGTAHRTRSLEVISSSPSSYMSSPDVHISNPDLLRPYTSSSSLHSPYFNRTVTSPESQEPYHFHSSSETPVFRSFRQFPLVSFEEAHECFTYGGISEQVFMWEANLILGGIPVQDQYRDLRLDIDSMSYEDLLALEESIGNVCTGLEKDAISSCLKSKLYTINNDLAPNQENSELRCSICQVDFEEGNELGTLKCGHSHHVQCIEEWLMRKNQCPICKSSAFTKTET